MTALRLLTLPGWQGSGPDHWQTRWERLYGFSRVEQHDWDRPLRGDWAARLEDAVLADRTPAVLVAHSLGCHLVAAWASHTRDPGRVRAALLVAPPDAERLDAPELHGWRRPVLDRLPFASTVVASRDDPYCRVDRARELASAWGSAFVDAGAHGHLNAASGLGNWPAGRNLLDALLARMADR